MVAFSWVELRQKVAVVEVAAQRIKAGAGEKRTKVEAEAKAAMNSTEVEEIRVMVEAEVEAELIRAKAKVAQGEARRMPKVHTVQTLNLHWEQEKLLDSSEELKAGLMVEIELTMTLGVQLAVQIFDSRLDQRKAKMLGCSRPPI